MKKRIFKVLLVILLAVPFAIYKTSNVSAVSVTATISSKGTVAPGETFDVTVSVSGNQIAFDFFVAVDGSLSIVSGLTRVTGPNSATSGIIKVKAGESGTGRIYITDSDSMLIETKEPVTVSGSKAITIQAAAVVTTKDETVNNVVVPFKTVQQKDPTLDKDKTVVKQEGKNGLADVTYKVTYTDGKETGRKEISRTTTTEPINKIVLVGTKVTTEPVVDKNSDATLKGLTVSEGTLSPVFGKGTSKYTVTLNGDVTSVTVTGSVNDSKASISGNGSVSLPEFGSKSHNLVVTAEDGTKNTITINFKKPEKVIEKISLGSGYTWQAYEGNRKLQGYTTQPLQVDGKEITAYVSASGDVVVYALNEAGNGDFYHYDKETKTIGDKFETVVINEVEYVKVKIPSDMVKLGMKQAPFTISNVNLEAFSFNDESLKDYRVFYLSKQGEKPTNYLLDTKSNNLLNIGDAQLLSKDEINRLESTKPSGQVDPTPVQPIVLEDTSLVSILFMVIGVISLLCLILSVVLLKKSRSTR